MSIDFAGQVYAPCFDLFARPVTITPVASQPGAPAYGARGIFDTNEIAIEAMDGSLLTDNRTELDIFEPEFPVLPRQLDLVSIPADGDLLGGDFEVASVNAGNAGGEVTLLLRRLVQSLPADHVLTVADFKVGPPDLALPAL